MYIIKFSKIDAITVVIGSEQELNYTWSLGTSCDDKGNYDFTSFDPVFVQLLESNHPYKSFTHKHNGQNYEITFEYSEWVVKHVMQFNKIRKPIKKRPLRRTEKVVYLFCEGCGNHVPIKPVIIGKYDLSSFPLIIINIEKNKIVILINIPT